jgi:hypothetical protein
MKPSTFGVGPGADADPEDLVMMKGGCWSRCQRRDGDNLNLTDRVRALLSQMPHPSDNIHTQNDLLG